MFAVYDAVRLAERESRSALPNAPVVQAKERAGSSRRSSFRLAASERLHRLADALEPNRELLEPCYTPDPCRGC
jgi:hypothetical protein